MWWCYKVKLKIPIDILSKHVDVSVTRKALILITSRNHLQRIYIKIYIKSIDENEDAISFNCKLKMKINFSFKRVINQSFTELRLKVLKSVLKNAPTLKRILQAKTHTFVMNSLITIIYFLC